MIFVYDIMLNFNEHLYDFYDWKETDEISHYRKIPLIKVSEKVYKHFINNGIKVEMEFLDMIKDKAQVYKSRLLKSDGYSVIFTNGYDTVAVNFNEKGEIKYRSRLRVNDEVEVLELSNNLKIKTFRYEIYKSENCLMNFLTRSESKVINEILNKLNEIKDNTSLINYLYYEWTGKVYKGKNSFNDLINEISKEYSDKCNDFLEVLDISTYKNV